MTSRAFTKSRAPFVAVCASGWFGYLMPGCSHPDQPGGAGTGLPTSTSVGDASDDESSSETGSVSSEDGTVGSSSPTGAADPTTSDDTSGGTTTLMGTTTGDSTIATTTSTMDDSTSAMDVTSDDGAPAESDTGVPPTTLDPGTVAQIDGVFSPWDKPDSLGCAVAVARDGAVAYQRGYGVTNLTTKQPITGKTVFYLASMSKQVTGAAIALAVEDGEVTVEDGIRTHLPSLPGYADDIRVRHLLYHTSGLTEYLIDLSSPKTNADAIDFLAGKTLDFTTGSQYNYTNTNYVVLAELVRASTGMSFRQFAQQRMFMPLEMNHTQVRDETSPTIPPNSATGYILNAGSWIDTTPFLETFFANGDGNVWSCAEDMVKWGSNFGNQVVGGAAWFSMMTTSGKTDYGASVDYAFGIIPDSHAGRPTVSHNGVALGYYTQGIYFTDGDGDAVVVLCNAGAEARADDLAPQVVNIVF